MKGLKPLQEKEQSWHELLRNTSRLRAVIDVRKDKGWDCDYQTENTKNWHDPSQEWIINY